VSTDRPNSRHDSTAPDQDVVRLTAWLTGQVQGVGMRWWIRARALELGLVGSAANRSDGRVEVVAEGQRRAAEALLALLNEQPRGGRPGQVTGVAERWGAARGGLEGFQER
jgi:acylphosphatase